jgi:hypothetical protein
MYKAATLPGRVMSGETPFVAGDPGSTAEVMNLAGSFGPAVNPMVRSGDRAIAGVKMAAKDPTLAKVPSSAELLKSGGNRLDQYRGMDIPYNPQAIGALGTQIEQEILKKGVLPENSPQLYAFLNAIKQTNPKSGGPGATVSAGPANIMAMRENLASLFGKSGEHQKGVGVAFDKLNEFIEKPPAGAVVAGPSSSPSFLSALGPETYATGRADYSAGKRIAGLEDIKRTADFRDNATGADSLRSRITAHILDARKTRGYTPEEKATLEAVPFDTTFASLKRKIGNVMAGGGSGGGTAASMGVAGTAADYLGLPRSVATGVGVATPFVGNWLKRSAGEGTEEALNKFIDMTARRSPLFRSMGRQDLVHDVAPSRDAIARQLMRTPQLLQGLPPEAPPVLPYDPNRA